MFPKGLIALLAVFVAIAFGAFALWRHNTAVTDQKMQSLQRELAAAQARDQGGPRDPSGQPGAAGGAPTQGPTDFPFRKPSTPAPLRNVTPRLSPP